MVISVDCHQTDRSKPSLGNRRVIGAISVLIAVACFEDSVLIALGCCPHPTTSDSKIIPSIMSFIKGSGMHNGIFRFFYNATRVARSDASPFAPLFSRRPRAA